MYITIKQTPKLKQYNIMDFIEGKPYQEHNNNDTTTTYTMYKEDNEITPIELDKIINKYKMVEMGAAITAMAEKAKPFLEVPRQSLYTSFSIPKKTGGLRHIDAPIGTLMEYLRNMKLMFEYKLRTLTHNNAYAYVKQRCTVDALKQHQANESKWFLKLDVKDFFPSCTTEVIMRQLKKLFPFSILCLNDDTEKALTTIIEMCTLNGALPQGTPMSPLLTNLIMIPVDDNLLKTLRPNHIYTRYADDILISSRVKFNPEQIEKLVDGIFKAHDLPFIIKKEKTRFGSSAGRNWNLGLMLNKDNNITIGHKQKQRCRAMVFSFLQDLTNGTIWDIIDVQQMVGLLSYYRNIEENYIDYVINKYNEKFKVDFYKVTRGLINGEPRTINNKI